MKPYACYSCVDPGGQGRLLEGLGIDARFADPKSAWPVFGVMDQFDLNSVTLAGGQGPKLEIVGLSFRFAGPEQQKRIDHNKSAPNPGSPIQPDGLTAMDWLHLQFKGKLRCTSGPTPWIPIVVEVVDARYITVPTSTAKASVTGKRKAAPADAQSLLTGWRFGFDLISAGGTTPKSKPPMHQRDPNDPTSVENSICELNPDGAFPMLGFWDVDGTFKRDDKSIFSFACTKREVGKCVDYGQYSLSKPSQGLDFLQACGRMMTADYCGKGQSYTKDDTWIEFWDTNANSKTSMTGATGKEGAEKPTAFFEGAWSADKLLCIDHVRHPNINWDPPADCLKTVPACHSDSQANPNNKQQMIFSESCKPAPCTVK